jgi:hypothetical protein
MVLGDVEESVTARELDEETEEEIVKVRLQHLPPSAIINFSSCNISTQ